MSYKTSNKHAKATFTNLSTVTNDKTLGKQS